VIVKRALAILFCLLLIGAQVFSVGASLVAAKAPVCNGCDCGQTCCAPPAPDSQPISAAPVPAPAQTQLVFAGVSVPTISLPNPAAVEFPSLTSPTFHQNTVPLYEQNYALLI
jgi:hypothetical protein